MQNSNTFNKHEDGKNAEPNDLNRIVSIINESLPSEAALCLGKRNLVSSRSSCFEPRSAPQFLTYYDLLLIGTEQVPDLKAKNTSIEEIAEVTGLSFDEIDLL